MPTNLFHQAYAVYPSVKLKGYKINPKTKKKEFGFLKELLFGDYLKPSIVGNDYERLTIKEGTKEVEYIKVRARGKDGYIKETEMQQNSILEVNFVDVGQGDGCHIVTPDNQHFLIDAGPTDNMYRFLKWRFNLKYATTPPPPFTVISSHSDLDHYRGFAKIFAATKNAKQQFSISKIYHNGLVEVSGTSPSTLGKLITHNGHDYITNLCDSDVAFNKRVKSAAKPGVFITTMTKSTAKKQSLHLGSKPVYKKGGMSMDILGPVLSKINGKSALPVLGEGREQKGKTKNGHSVIIKLTIGKLRLLLGGDLNTYAENYILKHFTGIDVAELRNQLNDPELLPAKRKSLEAKLDKAIINAREILEVDIAKSCHHGSADFSSDFLKALNAIATIVSSGDDEPHTHPRPDTLGTIGKHSRGERSLIFCTELARSSKEYVDIAKAKSESKKERVVTVYGMINVRTDGEKVIIAQKMERRSGAKNWDIHKLVWNKEKKQFVYDQYLKYNK